MENYALTNNAHEEEDARMESWLENQDIDEVNEAEGNNKYGIKN